MEWCLCLPCGQPDHFCDIDHGRKNAKGRSVAFSLDEVMAGMSKGTVMYKLRPPDRSYRRKYKVDLQLMRLSYAPSNKCFWRKVRDHQAVDLHDLREVRDGWRSDVFNGLEARLQRRMDAAFHPTLRRKMREENCLSLVFEQPRRWEVLDLVAPDPPTRDAWLRGLNQLIACCRSEQRRHERVRWLKEQVRSADSNHNGYLNFEECLLLLKQLNISMSSREAKALFDDSNTNKGKVDAGQEALDPQEFVEFYHKLIRRPELEDIMKKYSVSRSLLWGPEELQKFLHKEQNILSSTKECVGMIEKYETSGEDKIDGYLSLRGFQEMLLSVDFSIFNKKHHIIYQDMKQPLSHYYIASSHNTYLIQDQLIGDSSIEGYIRALMSGCRCIELDVWDGAEEEPRILHGHTLTSEILLRDVLGAIQDYAFKASQYPVILSIENHCSVTQQIKMAYYFTEILGDYLYKKPVGEDETEFPSPEDLARKILIKAKKLKVSDGGEHHPLVDEQDVQVAPPAFDHSNEKVLQQPMTAPAKKMKDSDGGENHPLEDEQDVQVAPPAFDHSNENVLQQPMAAPSHTKGIAKELSDLVNYCSAEKFKSFQECRRSWSFYEMASFQEVAGLSLGADQGPEFADHNKIHLSRVYPKATRADSSNYDPLPFWNFGCQMVALNYQTWDEHMFINQAKFAQNGNCGYILKPRYLREKDACYHPSQSPHASYKRSVVIKVISGQYIPKPGRSLEGEVVDPYVSVEVTGHPLDQQKSKTHYVSNNGFHPVWDETVELTIQAPEAAMITFRVKDYSAVAKNQLLGKFALPCSSLTEGYRSVHLQDERGLSLSPAAILVHVRIEHQR